MSNHNEATTTHNNTNSKQERSPQEIARLVAARVQERDGWSVNGVVEAIHPPVSLATRNMVKNLSGMQFATQEELDRVFAVQDLNWQELTTVPASSSSSSNKKQLRLTWLGHASLLVQCGTFNLLCDPVFSQRCSPNQLVGPKRHRRTPCSLPELCFRLPIHCVIISHNHYDHLDYHSIQDIVRYSKNTPKFIVPLGLREWFNKHVPQATVIHELDWHESVVVVTKATTAAATAAAGTRTNETSCKITATPARHWSNRVNNRDKTLWCGYVCQFGTNDNDDKKKKKFWFPGDTAWFDEISDVVGNRHGPFDVAALPIGAYEPREYMRYYHINVDEAVRIKDSVRAAHAVPIHYGTYPLTSEPIMEPPERLQKLMKGRKDEDSFQPWLIGESKLF